MQVDLSAEDVRSIETFITYYEKNRVKFNDEILARLDAAAPLFRGIINRQKEYQDWCLITWNDNMPRALKGITSMWDSVNVDHVSMICIALGRIVTEKVVRSDLLRDDEQPILRIIAGRGVTQQLYERDEHDFFLPRLRDRVRDSIREQEINAFRVEVDKSVFEVNKMKGEVDVRSETWQKTSKDAEERLSDYEKRFAAYEQRAKQLQSKYNFVALTAAFEDIENKKREELDNANTNMTKFGWLIVTPLILSFAISAIMFVSAGFDARPLQEKAIWMLPAVLPLEAILIYFFRINLKNAQSLKAQILQLELRQSLCAFIESYTDFREKKKDTPLEKFEALIFSSITPDPDAIPSTFDGVDQLANLAKAVRGA